MIRNLRRVTLCPLLQNVGFIVAVSTKEYHLHLTSWMAQFKKRSSLISAVSTDTVLLTFFQVARVHVWPGQLPTKRRSRVQYCTQPHSQVLRSFIFYLDDEVKWHHTDRLLLQFNRLSEMPWCLLAHMWVTKLLWKSCLVRIEMEKEKGRLRSTVRMSHPRPVQSSVSGGCIMYPKTSEKWAGYR